MTPDERWKSSLGADLKPDWSLVPWEGLAQVVAVMSWSEAQKHSGGEWQTKTAAYHAGKAIGHTVAHLRGKVTDDESGLPSLAHAAARALMACGVGE